MKNNSWHSWIRQHSWQILSLLTGFIVMFTILRSDVVHNTKRILANELKLRDVSTKEDILRVEKRLDRMEDKLDRLIEREL